VGLARRFGRPWQVVRKAVAAVTIYGYERVKSGCRQHNREKIR
jgi:hypothetical protein